MKEQFVYLRLKSHDGIAHDCVVGPFEYLQQTIGEIQDPDGDVIVEAAIGIGVGQWDLADNAARIFSDESGEPFLCKGYSDIVISTRLPTPGERFIWYKTVMEPEGAR